MDHSPSRHISYIEECLDAWALEYYSWSELLLVELSWQEIERLDADDPDAQGFAPISPFEELSKIIREKKECPEIDISFHNFLPGTDNTLYGIGGTIFCRAQDDMDFLDEYPDIFSTRVMEETIGLDAFDALAPEKQEHLVETRKYCTAWVKKHFEHALMRQELSRCEKKSALGSESLDFMRNAIILEEIVDQYTKGILSIGSFDAIDAQLSHSQASLDEVLKICLMIASFFFKSICAQTVERAERKETANAPSPEAMLIKLGNYPKNYSLLLRWRVSVDTSFAIPIFYIHDKNISDFLHDSDRVRGCYHTDGGFVTVYGDAKTNDSKDVVNHELHHHIYSKLLATLKIQTDRVVDEILAYIFDEWYDLPTIYSILTDESGAYKFKPDEVVKRLNTVKLFLEAGFSRRMTAAILLLMPTEKWEQCDQVSVDGWLAIMKHLVDFPTTSSLRQVFSRRAMENIDKK